MKTENTTPQPTTRIFVLDRGWVFVGKPGKSTAQHVVIDNARCIRRWGTNQGIAELADGPRANTVLDAPAQLVVPRKSIIFEVLCTRDW